MNSRIYTHHRGEQAKVSKPHRKTVQMLKDLIRVNKDRITGYEKAAHEENKMDTGIRNMLSRMATESRSYVNSLHAEVIRLGSAPVTQDTITGKVYLFWLDLKADFKGPFAAAAGATSSNIAGATPSATPISGLLDACERGEEAVRKVYRRALDTCDHLPDNILMLLERQLGALEQSHLLIKNTRSGYHSNYRPL
jgi:hypothetical protein